LGYYRLALLIDDKHALRCVNEAPTTAYAALAIHVYHESSPRKYSAVIGAGYRVGVVENLGCDLVAQLE
jgi:hypothetical protein